MAADPSPTHYQVLQVDPAADPDVIEAAYRRLARRYHPDVDASPDAAARMARINAAYQVLRRPETRAEYDRQIARQSAPPLNRPPIPSAPPLIRRAPPPTWPPPGENRGAGRFPRRPPLVVVIGLMVVALAPLGAAVLLQLSAMFHDAQWTPSSQPRPRDTPAPALAPLVAPTQRSLPAPLFTPLPTPTALPTATPRSASTPRAAAQPGAAGSPLDAYVAEALPMADAMQEQFGVLTGQIDRATPATRTQVCAELLAPDSALAQLQMTAAQARALVAPAVMSAYQAELLVTATAADELAQRITDVCSLRRGQIALVRQSAGLLAQHLSLSQAALHNYQAPVPLPESVRAPADGQAAIYEVMNQTGATLHVELAGPDRAQADLLDGETKRLTLPAGQYDILAVANSLRLAPFRGQETLNTGEVATARYTPRPSGG